MGIKTGKKALFTEINITPLTDIFLVLLIIMMVVAPTFQSIDNSIDVPEINSGTSIEQGKVVVSITKEGVLYIDGKPTTMSFLSKDLEQLKSSDEKNEVVVKADAKVKSAIIMDVMDAAQEANYKKLIVAGEPLTRKEQKELSSKNEISKNFNDEINKNTIDGASVPIPQDSTYEDWSVQ